MLAGYEGFEWDKGNQDKNFLKHGVTNRECEEAFLDPGKRIFRDKLHLSGERRFVLLAKTFNGRLLFAIFILRRSKVRVISSRDINKKEKHLYEKAS